VGGSGDRAALVATMLPGLAAVAALVFTWVSVTQVSEELAISKQGQIADRYDKALERLSDNSANIRRGAIFSLQGIMEDSPRQQPAVIDALSGYIRTHATKKMSAEKAPDVQAALSALGHRNPSQDGDSTINLRGVHLANADLRGVDLTEANLGEAVLSNCNLEGANLSGADLRLAWLRQGSLKGANLAEANLGRAVLNDANMIKAKLSNARLDSAVLKSTVLVNADLRNAYLYEADLQEADLTNADLTNADLTRASLEAARLDGADLTSVRRPEADLPTSVPSRISSPSAGAPDAEG
jgi:uncharacterized protein YjbI with pentapeptide repeats